MSDLALHEASVLALRECGASTTRIAEPDIFRVESSPGAGSVDYVRVLGPLWLCFRARTSTPAGTIVDALRAIGDRELARVGGRRLLAKLPAPDYPVLAPCDSLVLVHPDAAQLALSPKARDRMPTTYRLLFGYRFEWKEREHLNDLGCRLNDLGDSTDLGRDPIPAISYRANYIRSGAQSDGKKLWIELYSIVARDLGRLHEQRGFVEVENFEHEVVTIHFDDRYTIEQGKEVWVPTRDSVVEWFDIFCRKGAAAAAGARRLDVPR